MPLRERYPFLQDEGSLPYDSVRFASRTRLNGWDGLLSGMASVGSFLNSFQELTEDELLHVWSTLYYGKRGC